ncbi:MAG: GtrA family protein [Hahellaceae bacterium]|nr:GtrA family protein [Hahellaceae bacterium]MCP5211311.1 GtrA family protein [Hahellaceae bacterium]
MKKQFALFILVGGIQYLLDASVFSILILYLTPEFANVFSRMAGAASGYILNGRYTFKSEGKAVISTSGFFRFTAVWCFMTAISTLSISLLMSWSSNNDWGFAVFSKLLVEAVMVVFSFALQKFFVFR